MGSCNIRQHTFLRVHCYGQLQHKTRYPFLRVHCHGQLQHKTRYPFLRVYYHGQLLHTFFTCSLPWAVATEDRRRKKSAFIPMGSWNIRYLFLRVHHHGQLQHTTSYFFYVFITMGSYNIRQDILFFTCSLPWAVAT